MKNRSATLARMKPVLAALVLVLAAGCGASTPAKVKSDDTPAKIVDSAPASPSDSPTTQTASLGSTVEVADWNVRVTKVVLNADAVIHQANEFNDKPKGQYVLVSFNATYKGDQRTEDYQADLTWTFTGTDKQVYDEASAVTPAATGDAPTEARKGGTVKGQVVFDMKPSLIHGGTLTVSGYTADFDEVYADFAIR